MIDFADIAQMCAPAVHPTTLAAIVRTESGFNPFAIGVVNGSLERQPKNLPEAVATAEALVRAGWNASFGLGQINLKNLAPLGLDTKTVFDPCKNLAAASTILSEAYERAGKVFGDEQSALRGALSAYYSGNFTTGFKHGYVQKVAANAAPLDKPAPASPEAPAPIKVIPAIEAAPAGAVRLTAEPNAGAAAPAKPNPPPPDRSRSGTSVIFKAP